MSNILLHSREAWGPWVLPEKSPPPPLGRATSPWSVPAWAPLPGPSPRCKGSPIRGATASLLAGSKQTSDNTSQSWASSRFLRAKWNCCWVPPLLGEDVGTQIPTWDLCRGARGMPIPHSDVFSNLHNCRWLGMEPKGVIIPDHSHGDKTHHSQHLLTGSECNNTIPSLITIAHLWGVPVPQQHIVLLCPPPVRSWHQTEYLHPWK